MYVEVLSEDVWKRRNAGRQLLIIQADFNTPNSRDSMKLAPLANALATAVQQVGAENAVVVCALATRCCSARNQRAFRLDTSAHEILRHGRQMDICT